MQEVHIIARSKNPQVTRFAPISLGGFNTQGDRGEKIRHYYTDGSKNSLGEFAEADLLIQDGGILKVDREIARDAHNIKTLEVALSMNPPKLPPNLMLKIVDLSQSATSNIARRKKVMTLSNRVMASDLEMIQSMARSLGFGSMNGRTPDEIEEFVLGKIESDPDHIEQILDGSDREAIFEMDKAIEANLITTLDGNYRYGDVFLGTSQASAIGFFHDNPEVFGDIKLRNSKFYSRRPGAPVVRNTPPKSIQEGIAPRVPVAETTTGEIDYDAIATKAVEKGVIVNKKGGPAANRGYYFGSVMLGEDDAAMRAFLRNEQNESVLNMLQNAVK